MTRGRSNCRRRASRRRRSDTPRTGRPGRGACRRPRSTCSQQIRAESRSIPPTASEGRRRDSNSRASVPSDYLAPCYQYVSSAVNKYVVYTISSEYPLGPHHPVHGRRINRTGITPPDSLQPGQKPHEAARNPKVRMEREVDVLVIGAGPTGSTAAKYAARGGADVLLVEKRSEIGTPVRCGEGVAKRWLDEIGLAPSGEFICHEVEGARVIAPDGTALVVDETRAGNECGYVLERDLFDRYLAKEAAKAGAEILIKTSAVGLLRDDGQIIGARCEHMAETFEAREKTVAPGLILAGDAARLIDPLTGGGILNGCLSGKYAGEVAADAVSAGKATEEALSSYEKRWRARLEEELARHYLIKERLIRLDDETVNKAVRAILEAKVERITAATVLDAIRQHEPGLLALFEGFL